MLSEADFTQDGKKGTQMTQMTRITRICADFFHFGTQRRKDTKSQNSLKSLKSLKSSPSQKSPKNNHASTSLSDREIISHKTEKQSIRWVALPSNGLSTTRSLSAMLSAAEVRSRSAENQRQTSKQQTIINKQFKL